MKKATALGALVCAIAALTATPAHADKGGLPHHRNAPTGVTSLLSCDGITCTYTVTGIAPSSFVSAKFVYHGDNGQGANTGTSMWPVDALGMFTYTEPESFFTWGNVPGTLESVLTTGESWVAPIVPGSFASTHIG